MTKMNLKWTKWNKGKFLPYEGILLEAKDYDAVQWIRWEVFDKLDKISEYRLAMELAKGKITKAEFDWAMKYFKYLKTYFKI